MDGGLRGIAHRIDAEGGENMPFTRHGYAGMAPVESGGPTALCAETGRCAAEVLRQCTNSQQRIGMHFKAGRSRLRRYDEQA